MVYGKVCHLLVELEHKAYWEIQFLNFDEKVYGRRRLLKSDEIEEMRLRYYENIVIYIERTKNYHDENLVKRDFQQGHKVLL